MPRIREFFERIRKKKRLLFTFCVAEKTTINETNKKGDFCLKAAMLRAFRKNRPYFVKYINETKRMHDFKLHSVYLLFEDGGYIFGYRFF